MAFSSELELNLLKQRVKFRAMLVQVCEKMDDKDLERLGFLYEIAVESNKAIDVMDSLVKKDKVLDKPDYLLYFKEVLTEKLHKKELGDIVDRYITLRRREPPVIHGITATTNDVPTPVAEQVSTRLVISQLWLYISGQGTSS